MARLLGVAIISLFVTLTQFAFQKSKPEKTLLLDFSEGFTNESEKLKSVSEAFKFKNASVEELRSQHLATRLSYKKIEFIYDYLYPDYVKSHFNGAPLLQAKKHDSKAFVVPPEGMQILDEMIFADEVEEEHLQIAILAQKLEEHALLLKEQFAQEELEDAELIQAMRMELIRIFTLGLTGFDTPGSLNAIEEAHAAIASMKNVLELIKEDEPEFEEASKLMSEALASLEKDTLFDSFDRLSFLMQYLNPLYQKLSCCVEFEPLPATAWNQKSDNLFAANFLDPYFFTDLKEEEDSDLKRKIGKKLFYDVRLSKSNRMSCGSCHNPQKAFTDGLPKSESNVEGETVLRNSPTLLNAVYADRYFYDLRAFSLEQQSQHVIFNYSEFNTANAEIVSKLKGEEEYKKLFKEAFEDQKINTHNFTQALASYVLSLQALNSKFDQFVRNEIPSIEEEVKRGFNLFMGKANCGTCHFAPTFSGLVPPYYRESESEILGVLENPKTLKKAVDSDLGRLNNQIHDEEAWIYEKSFKTSTVRNIELTAPYFHNGAYKNLNEVMDFYNAGGGLGHGFEVVNQTLSGDPLGLNKTEIADIIAFMNALTDTTSYTY